MGEKILEVVVGRVDIGEGVPPPVPPAHAVEEFIAEHRKLKGIIDKFGKQGVCVTLTTLQSQGKVSEERLNTHRRMFEEHDAAAFIDGEGLCGKEALKRLMKKLEVEL